MHVGDKPIDSHFQQHHQGAAHILPHLRVIVHSQGKQVLQGGEGQPQQGPWPSPCSPPAWQPTSMKVSMLSISAWARSMMNWFTQAMAWDLAGSGHVGHPRPAYSRPPADPWGAAPTGSWGCSA